MKGIAYTQWDRWIVVAFGSRPPPRGEWEAYAELLRTAIGHQQRGLIVSHGGSLEPYQRREADAILGPRRERDRRLAVVTTSTFTWGFVKALSLFDPSYQSFRPADMDRAFEYIELPRSSWETVRRIAGELTAEVA